MPNLRCPFCGETGFQHLDEVTTHLATVDDKGQNICPKLNDRIDPHKAGNLFPMKVAGKKYAPKNHDGKFMCLDSNGKITKKSLVTELLHA